MEIIVDHACGMAVQRGADVFQCGILAAPAGDYATFCHLY